MNNFIILPGSASRDLATQAAHALDEPVGDCTTTRFPDGETCVRIDQSVRGKDVFIVQSTAPPVNENLVELLLMSDACRRAAAGTITAVIPYFGYARSDKRHGHRESISASMLAALLEGVGIGQVITLDLHAPQIEGFFKIPVDALSAVTLLGDVLSDVVPDGTVVVAPDTGRMKMALTYAQKLKTSVVVLHEQREENSEIDTLELVGNVQDKPCLIVDDMIATGETIAESIEALLAAGAKPEIYLAATHFLSLPNVAQKLSHVAVRQIFVTDTIRVEEDCGPQLRVVSVAPLIATAIQSAAEHQSMQGM